MVAGVGGEAERTRNGGREIMTKEAKKHSAGSIRAMTRIYALFKQYENSDVNFEDEICEAIDEETAAPELLEGFKKLLAEAAETTRMNCVEWGEIYGNGTDVEHMARQLIAKIEGKS